MIKKQRDLVIKYQIQYLNVYFVNVVLKKWNKFNKINNNWMLNYWNQKIGKKEKLKKIRVQHNLVKLI